MSRFRRHLVPLLLMLPVIFVCGKLLLTPVEVYRFIPGAPPLTTYEGFDCGWPWVFMQQRYEARMPSTLPVLEIKQFGVWLVIADTAVLIASIAFCFFIAVRMRSRSRNWTQFSLRGVLAFVTLLAIGCGWWATQRNQSALESLLIKKIEAKYSLLLNEGFFAPEWLRRLAGDENLRAFRRITSVYLQLDFDQSNLTKEFATIFSRFSHLRSLSLLPKTGVDVSYENPSPLRIDKLAALRLEELDFAEGRADDETLRMIASLPNLKSFSISRCPVSDRGLAEIASCKSLERLELEFCHDVTSDGIASLGSLNRLAEIVLSVGKIDNSTMTSLANLKSLQEIRVTSRHMTEDVAQRLVDLPKLQKATINCSSLKLSDATKSLLRARIPKIILNQIELK